MSDHEHAFRLQTFREDDRAIWTEPIYLCIVCAEQGHLIPDDEPVSA